MGKKNWANWLVYNKDTLALLELGLAHCRELRYDLKNNYILI